MIFQDHFSAQATSYALSRPHYPQPLFDYLQDLVGAQAVVWEAGCGSGQATADLATRFARVYATEPSAAALAHAPQIDRVSYANETAENTQLSDASVDLIVVAQALHWFDQPAFFAECERVLRPGGVLAVWSYQDFHPPAEIAAACCGFRDRIASYWPSQRTLVDQGYADTDWPFEAIDVPSFAMMVDWELGQLIGYLSSFSAVVRCAKQTGSDPVMAFVDQFAAQWGDAHASKRIRWPLKLHCRRRPGEH